MRKRKAINTTVALEYFKNRDHLIKKNKTNREFVSDWKDDDMLKPMIKITETKVERVPGNKSLSMRKNKQFSR